MLPKTLTLSDLFVQLGLPSEEEDIENFIEQNKGMMQATHIEDAAIWNDAQATFIRSSLLEDAEWAELIDQLNSRLHEKGA